LRNGRLIECIIQRVHAPELSRAAKNQVMRFVFRDVVDIIIGKRTATITATIIIPETDTVEACQSFGCSDPYKTPGILGYTTDTIITKTIYGCIVLEEWTSATVTQGIRYAGKSFNTYNASTKQWQQTWVDNVGGSNEYLEGKGGNNSVVFKTSSFSYSKDTMAIRRLSFYKLSDDKVRQHGEISKDNGNSWSTEYDLEYRRRK